MRFIFVLLAFLTGTTFADSNLRPINLPKKCSDNMLTLKVGHLYSAQSYVSRPVCAVQIIADIESYGRIDSPYTMVGIVYYCNGTVDITYYTKNGKYRTDKSSAEDLVKDLGPAKQKESVK